MPNNKKKPNVGNFVRGVDVNGTRCWGVVYLAPTQCEHVDIKTPATGEQFVHVDPAAVDVIPEEQLNAEETAFLRNAHVELAALLPCNGYSFVQGFRNCPVAAKNPFAALNSGNHDDRARESHFVGGWRDRFPSDRF